MASTLQGVQWTLAQQCALRTGSDWSKPEVANAQLSRIRLFSESQGEVLDDIWITGHTVWTIDIPRGYVISKIFAKYGGLSHIESQCHSCPANPDLSGLAGCTGCFFYNPESKQLDDWINELLEHRQLRARFNAAFLQTHPRWFGFWTQSPLNSEQCALLEILFKELYGEEKDSSDQRDIQAFLSALRISINQKIPINVMMSAPGHADLGIVWTYPHCPRCKASALLLEGEQHCKVCNYAFVAQETTYEESYSDEYPKLETELGETGYEAFVRKYLLRKGHSLAEIDKVLQERREFNEKWRRKNSLK